MPAFGNRSDTGIIAEPMMPKACSMPCIWSTFTKASSVVIFIAWFPSFAGWRAVRRSKQFVPEIVPAVHGALADAPKRREQPVMGQRRSEDRQVEPLPLAGDDL